MPDLLGVQGQPLTAELYALDSTQGRLPLPAGEPRMQLRAWPTAARVVLDLAAAGYLERDDDLSEVRVRVPGEVTAAFPLELHFDLWLGDQRILDGRVLTSPAVSR